MFHSVGDTAGEIWKLLKVEGPLSVSAVAEKTKRPKSTVYMAIGWLAREDKVAFRDTSRGTFISLK